MLIDGPLFLLVHNYARSPHCWIPTAEPLTLGLRYVMLHVNQPWVSDDAVAYARYYIVDGCCCQVLVQAQPDAGPDHGVDAHGPRHPAKQLPSGTKLVFTPWRSGDVGILVLPRKKCSRISVLYTGHVFKKNQVCHVWWALQ